MEEWELSVSPEEIGEVLTVDGEIASVGGLAHAQYGEILLFPSGVKGMVIRRPSRVQSYTSDPAWSRKPLRRASSCSQWRGTLRW